MRTSIRLFVAAPLAPGAELAATPAQAHYLATVMRRRTGDPLRLFNGRDGEWCARISALRSDRGTLVAQRQLRTQIAEPDVWLAFALLKRDATDLVVQKATELGVAALLPVVTERTNAARVNLTRLIAIATEAAEQSERLSVPAVPAPQTLTDLLATWPATRSLLVALERGDAPPILPTNGPVGLLIGPEGGFTAGERERLLTDCRVQPASLGPFVLRADTAAIVGLARLQAARRA
jgi:16S rRNA (uracil1498-N3)-methyltransferase